MFRLIAYEMEIGELMNKENLTICKKCKYIGMADDFYYCKKVEKIDVVFDPINGGWVVRALSRRCDVKNKGNCKDFELKTYLSLYERIVNRSGKLRK